VLLVKFVVHLQKQNKKTMENLKITIHRALAELKLIDGKINKSIGEITPLGCMQEGKLVDNIETVEDFKKRATSKYQSVFDLIQRKNIIKSAIVESNSRTKIKIGNKEMTVADAINYKKIIDFKKLLLEALKTKSSQVKMRFIMENEKINNIALENAKIMLGKQGDDKVKPNDNDVKAIMEPFIKRNELHLVDPLKVDDLITTLDDEINIFVTEVDAVLSESNATTFINI